MSAVAATAIVVVTLVPVNIVEHLTGTALWFRLAARGSRAPRLCARRKPRVGRSSASGRDQLGSGIRWGLAAIGVVAVAYLAGVLLPPTRPAFLDTRYHHDVTGTLRSAFVIIPLGTVLIEEIAFRSVLWGM